MKTNKHIAACIIALLITGTLQAQVPQFINYGGRVAVGAVNFDGSGQFKFAFVNADATTTFWSNDGTSIGGSEPTAAVTLPVAKGLYSVLLGNATLPNMTIVPATVFSNADVRLRVWFSDGMSGFQLMTPDQRIAAVGYAMMAGNVQNGAITAVQIAAGAVGASQIAAGAVGSAQIGAGAVGNTQLASSLTLGGTTTLSGVLSLPATSSPTVGVITQNGNRLLHTYGTNNLFAGSNAGNVTMTGTDNTALGYNAFVANTTGGANVAIGSYALYANTTGTANTALGFNALIANTTGYRNTATGFLTLLANTTGYENTAYGQEALWANTTGISNTACGMGTLYSNISGANNTAIGRSALYHNTTASSNVAIGYNALEGQSFNNSGTEWNSFNVAIGFQALQSNQPVSTATGMNNTALGTRALLANTTGANNSASGVDALRSNTTGNHNAAYGSAALLNNTSGLNNVAIGHDALLSNSTGNSNIAVGLSAGNALTTGSDNIAIGNAGLAGESSVIRIGTAGSQNKAFIAGISGVTSSGGAAVFVNASGQLGTVTSSRRFKENIATMDDASEAIFALRPVTFRYKPEIDPKAIPQFGLIAEDVDKVCPELVVRDESGTIQTVRYEQVNAMLLNEFLKAHHRVKELESRLTELETKDLVREERLTKLEQSLSPASKPAAVEVAPTAPKIAK